MIDIGTLVEHQRLNASLAVQLCQRWLIEKDQWNFRKEVTTDNLLTELPGLFKSGKQGKFNAVNHTF